MRITFAQKISMLMVGLIVLTGAMLTAVTAYQFREDLVREEVRSAYTIYLTTINYLSGHYFSHKGSFVESTLDFVLEERFLNTGGAAMGDETPRLTALSVFGADREQLYAFVSSERSFKEPLTPPLMEEGRFRIAINFKAGWMRASGPISSRGEVPGTVVLELPTTIHARIQTLYSKAAITLLVVGLIGTALAVYATRRFLAPVQTLIQATGHIQEGDFSIQLREDYQDEIGQMARAFNQMVRSISRRISTMGRIHQWSLKLTKEMDVRKLVQLMVRMFKDMSGASGVGVMYRSHKGVVDVLAEEGARPGAELHAMVAQLKPGDLETLANGEAVPFSSRNPGQTRTGAGEFPEQIILPLYRDERGEGVVALARRDSGTGYDPETISTLANLAQNAGLIIENARLYSELKEQERIQQEMQWAREIQQTLLPRAAPRLTGYEVYGYSRPAKEVGGDYYDYIPGNQPALYHLIIGDVSGKGVPAGLIMSVVRSLVHSYSEFEATPGLILQRVNRTLTEDLEPEMFVTASMMTVDFSTHSMRMVRAGHEPAILIRGDGSVSQLHPRGTALGLADCQHYEQNAEELVYALHQGDLIVLFTDGITEAQNPAGQEFGMERLIDCIRRYRHDPLASLGDQVLRHLGDFTRDREQLDDITLLALRRSRA